MQRRGKKGVWSLAILMCSLMFVLTACTTKLQGTYTNKEGIVEQSLTFEKENKVIVSAFGINVEGEYVIEKDKIIITYSLLNLSYDMEKSFEKKGNSIFIDGTQFTKE